MGTFNVIEHITGANLPTDDVTLYTNTGAAREFWSLKASVDDTPEKSERLRELQKQIGDSALTFHLQAFLPKIRSAIIEEANAKHPNDETAHTRFVMLRNLALVIKRVTDAEGNVDERAWTEDDIADIVENLPDEEQGKLFEAATELLFSTWRQDEAVTADF